MKILDAGHIYRLNGYDGGEEQELQFMKREGDNFPFNAHTFGGTNCQEVIRVLIDRTRYLYNQKPCAETEAALHSLESALMFYEMRAARLHGRSLDLRAPADLVWMATCKKCGHIGCNNVEHTNPE
jgi:hypothetical protein